MAEGTEIVNIYTKNKGEMILYHYSTYASIILSLYLVWKKKKIINSPFLLSSPYSKGSPPADWTFLVRESPTLIGSQLIVAF